MKLKSILVLPLCGLVTCFNACKSTKDDDPKSTGGDAITITAITGVTPTHIYVDDNIKITGTGFNTDITKDTVELVTIDDTGTVTVVSQDLSNPTLFHHWTVTSATPTEIVIHASTADAAYFNFNTSFFQHTMAFRVRSGGVVSTPFPVMLRRLFSFGTLSGGPNTELQVGVDPVAIQGTWFSDNCSMRLFITLCGKAQGQPWCTTEPYGTCDCDNFVEIPCDETWVYEDLGSQNIITNRLTVTIPLSLFGETTQNCSGNMFTYRTRMKMINEDGKEAFNFTWIYFRPCSGG